MAFYREPETTGVPAPSSRFEELDNIARNRARRHPQKPEFDFNQFTSQIGIAIDYCGWCDYCKAADLTSGIRSGGTWFMWLDRFMKDQDAKDLHNTQADALK